MTHVDYIPTLFSFTTEERRTALKKKAKKHKRVVSMKRKKCQHQRKATVSRAVEPSEQQEVTTADSTEIHDEWFQQTEECSSNIKQTSNMCEMESDDNVLVSQCSERVVVSV